MAMGPLLDAVFLGIVEGVTEFLPVSSTGHLIITADLLGTPGKEWKTFEIFIQMGAILAVLWDRRTTFDFLKAGFLKTAIRLAIAFFPAALVGLLTHHHIKEHLFSSRVVAWSLLIGGLVILLIEQRKTAPKIESLEAVTYAHAALIGLCQCVSLVPGASRAAATILGGMIVGLSRPVATEFSFLLAVPTIGAASLYDLYKSRSDLSLEHVPSFALGFAVSFVVALMVVRWLIGYVRRHDFRPFAWWRIALGALILVLRLPTPRT